MRNLVAFVLAMTVCHIASSDITHQWNFEDGTANDAVGIADGVVSSTGAVIASGALTLSGGTVEFDAAEIGIDTYNEVTIEAWANNSSVNTYYSGMLFSIYDPTSLFANNYLFLQPARGDNVTMAGYQIGPSEMPWSDESNVYGPEVFDTMVQYVMTISDVKVGLYMDGVLIGTTANTQGPLSGLGTGGATIGGGIYSAGNDPPWQGDIEQVTVYDRELGPGQIAANYAAGPVAVPEPATCALMSIFGTGLFFIRRRRFI